MFGPPPFLYQADTGDSADTDSCPEGPHADLLRDGLNEIAVVVKQAGDDHELIAVTAVGFAEVQFTYIDPCDY